MKGFKRNIAIVLLIAMSLMSFIGCSQQATTQGQFIAGTYEASARGMIGDIKIAVTFTEDRIEKIEILEHQETEGIADPALERIPQSIVANQSLGVDSITGATITSLAILNAVEDAATQAGADIEILKNKAVASTKGEKIEKTTDVIVIGGGGAGIAAAASSVENGAEVILIEKAAALGGNTLASGFAWNATNPEIQGKIGTMPGQIEMLKGVLELDEEGFGEFTDILKTLKEQITTYLDGDASTVFDSVEFHIIQAYQGGRRQDRDGNWIENDYDLLTTFAENSLPTLNWVQSLGGAFSEELTSPVGAMWLRGHNPVGKKQIFDALADYIVENGSEIMLETKADELIVKDGRIVGIKGTKADGTEVELYANKGVIMATGGYGANPSLAAEYNNYWPSIPEDMKTTNVSTVTGDGIIMGREIDANLVGMEFIQLMPTANEKSGSLTDGLLVAPQNYVFVNKEGKRFINEYAARDELAFAALEQTDEMFYTIADQPMALSAQNRPTQEMIDKMVEDGLIYRADTLEKLAEIIGCDPQTFVDEIEKYNSYVEAGKDPEYGKAVFEMQVKEGPFYACPAKPAIHHTMGGLEINVRGEVLDTASNVIPGFYAAGEVTGGIHGGNRLGGNAIADVFVFGRIAGENAATNK
ncbi:flavocytochrome c [Alkaliphilus metalliredigens QYMF]|uniref:Urocanate reductase n=1 Tax=Alkaliphilus metalliredigens (strain QYMF) TaxID=293826 RepID=A6TK39_ALKMQ|nr:flavocytochrome c [Alkaliphilus metalliredigens]ABR46557.1 flavocytochrome c [Alkaliphilus metalliredigens QYMF]